MTRRFDTGFTMLEILISIVIVAFGLLGIAGLQAYALKHNHSASMRLTATALASDMIDRMKANHRGVSEFLYNQPALSEYETPVANCATGGACSYSDLASNDRAEWQTRIGQSLPGGFGIICVDSTPGDGIPTAPACDNNGTVSWVVKIWWSDDRSNVNPTPQLFWTMFNP